MTQSNPAPKLYTQSLLRLGEMLKLLRQGDSLENRNLIKNHCNFLSEQGKKRNFLGWVKIMETAREAIADPENEYKSTIKLIITEIKQAGEKLQQNQEAEITVSEKLSALAPQVEEKLTENDNIDESINVVEEKEKEKVVEFDIPSQWQQELASFKFDISVDDDIWEDTIARRIKIKEKELDNELKYEGDDQSFSDDLEESIAALDIGDDSDQSLDDWLEDNSFVDQSEAVSAVFMGQQDHPHYSSRSDTAEEINNLFKTDPDQENLRIDQWSNSSLSNELDDWEEDLEFVESHAINKDTITRNLDDLFQEDEEEKSTNFHREKQQKNQSEQLLIYDNISDLENFITSDHNQEKKSLSDLASFINDHNIIYYDHINELDKFINFIEPKQKLIDWQELEIIVDDNLHLTANAYARIAENTDPDIEQEVSELDRLLREVDKTTNTTRWNKTPVASQNTNAKKNKVLSEQSMRVSVKQLDNINNLVGELVVRRNRLEEDQDRLRQFLENLLSHVQNLSEVGTRMQDLYERSLLEGALLASRERNQATVKAQLARVDGNTDTGNLNFRSPITKNGDTSPFGDLELDRFTGFHLISQEIIELIVRVRESTSDIQFLVDETEQLGRNLRQITTQLQEGVNQSRMVAFAINADRLPLPIRKIAQGYNKQVQLKIEGREVLIDKMILEHLWDPLLQLAKNSVTHGIEQPEERMRAGKPPMGIITVRAFLQGPQTVISVSDDGAGIHTDKVKQKAVQKKLITQQEADEMKDLEVYNLLFHAGFTTKEKADSHAGRGVGLDIVRSQLNQIRGSVSIDSVIGQGTTFTIRLPLTLSIGKALCCLNENGRIAFPMDGIEDTKDYSYQEIKINEQGQKCVLWRDNLLPYRPLNTLINYNRQLSRSVIYGGNQEDEKISIVILRGGNSLLAVQVDQVLGQEEIVIKQINGPLPKPKGIAGATVRSDGIVMPIGDVIELIEIAQGKLRIDVNLGDAKTTTFMEGMNEQPLVLLVDDSITVREMLSISFGKSGYRVEQARDGQEAWQKLRSGLRCDLVFCDIEMPRMNGLEFLKLLQEDENLSKIPVAMLTSRGADKHQRIAAELGACAYLIKPYVEKDLLDSAQRMLDGEVLLANSTKIAQQKVTIPTEQKVNDSNLSSAGKKSKSSPFVLIVDDSVVVREMLSMTFKKAGYQVEQARDGQDAWDKISNGLPCNVILCDIEMPRMNGLELLAKMQQDEKLSQIPVAMVTSRGAEKHRKIAAELGAKAYFTKPYLEEELLKATEDLIEGNILF